MQCLWASLPEFMQQSQALALTPCLDSDSDKCNTIHPHPHTAPTSLPPSFWIRGGKCHKSVRWNSAHVTFPSDLIASIQSASASHARPQGMKCALSQRSSCPVRTSTYKEKEVWVKPNGANETNRLSPSPRASKQEASQSFTTSSISFEREHWKLKGLGRLCTAKPLGVDVVHQVKKQTALRPVPYLQME